MKVIIDKGNTRTKVYFFADKEIIQKTTIINNDADYVNVLKEILDEKPVEAAIISDVSGVRSRLEDSFWGDTKVVKMGNGLKFPVSIAYRTPETLGYDRIANACAMPELNPNQHSLVIDIGTCIKFDHISEKGIFEGGSISPGMMLRYRSLHEFTGNLPYINALDQIPPIMGDTTESSIHAGVMNGIIDEISGFIERYRKKYQSIQIFVTGGDHEFFAPILKSPIFVAPDLTARGLNEILDINC